MARSNLHQSSLKGREPFRGRAALSGRGSKTGAAKFTLSAAFALLVSACASTGGQGGQSISIPYDPYNFNPDELNADAQAHCAAYGLRAYYEDETIDPTSVRWRYRHYACK